MAFRKYADSSVVKPDINLVGWDEVCHKAAAGSAFEKRASKVVFTQYDPKDYLLTHVTIIASVDTELSTAPLGKQIVDGFQINRKFADWLITPETSKYVNNNNDAWERKLLLACYKTFIGGENYVEHIQIPEMSKGKLIDAAARDVGDSIYVDLLVATSRKHKPLISAITGGQLRTLSMGCSVEATTCTKCGNVAYDETELCNHIRYFKGNEWIDETGKKRKIAELCGHISEEPGSVKFIEASWVANPAFTGAVLRSFLTEEEQEFAGVGQKMSIAFQGGPRLFVPGYMGKAAFSKTSDEGVGQNPTEESPAPKETGKGDPLEKVVQELVGLLREKAVEKVREEIGKDENRVSPLPDENRNDTLIKGALKYPIWNRIAKVVLGTVGGDRTAAKKLLYGMILYRSGGWKAVQASKDFKGREVLALVRVLDLANAKTRIAGENRLYKAVVAVGPLHSNADVNAYLTACRRVVGRDLTTDEKSSLVQKGRLFALGS